MSVASPSVSVLVPVFNCEAYIQETLDSLTNQSFADFEVIVCDDASSDRSVALSEKSANLDPRIKVFQHNDNVGMTQNWNRALGYARGQYVMKLDADDAFANKTLEALLKLIHQPNVLAAFCRTLECNDKLEPQINYRGEEALIRASIDPEQEHLKPAVDWYQHAFDDRQIWHSNAFILPTKLLRDIGGWDEQFGCASDTDLILRILELEGNIAHSSYQGVLYRMREGSISDNFRKADRLIDEAYSVTLSSLWRSWKMGRSLSYRTRLNWYRLQQNARLRSTSSSTQQRDLLALPFSIKALGSLQRALSGLKQQIFTNRK